MTKARWIPPSEAGDPPRPVRFLRTTLDPSACVLDSALMEDLATLQSSHPSSKSRLIFAKTNVEEVVKIMLQKNGGLAIGDIPWAHKVWYVSVFLFFSSFFFDGNLSSTLVYLGRKPSPEMYSSAGSATLSLTLRRGRRRRGKVKSSSKQACSATFTALISSSESVSLLGIHLSSI